MAMRAGLNNTFRACLKRASPIHSSSVPVRALSGTSASLALPERGSLAPPERGERRFVRIAGLSNYASKQDVEYFLKRNGLQVPDISLDEGGADSSVLPLLTQGTADVFQNISVWIYDAGTEADALHASDALSGKVSGMKLARAAAVDYRVISDMVGDGPSHSGHKQRRRKSLRKQLAVIAPAFEERGRTVLMTNIHVGCVPRLVWSFFSSFDVVDVRMLRRSGVASIIFRDEKEALRAIRERSNCLLQGKSQVYIKMFE